jgi:hypothetical protein
MARSAIDESGSATGDALAGQADAGAASGARLLAAGAQGKRTEEAALQIGVSTPVAVRWFRHAGGMPPLSLDEPTGRHLSFSEEIALLKAQGQGVRAIARELTRDPGTISRELQRNAATYGGKPDDRASVTQWKAQTAARCPKPAKLASNPRLQDYVQSRLSGQLQRPDGTSRPARQRPGRG